MKLFEGVPDVGKVADDAGIQRVEAERLLLELAWVTKTISRVGKGYLLGDSGFSRPDSVADRELTAFNATDGGFDLPDDTSWVSEIELSVILAERTGVDLAISDDVVVSVSDQLRQRGGTPLKTAPDVLALERDVEEQLMANTSVLDIWGWGLEEVRQQVRLDAHNRADLVGRRRDGTWVVIELKRGAALAETAHQVLRYLPLVQRQFADGEPVAGLVIADGDDEEFHDIVIGVPEPIFYLPTRCLDLPVCRPQTHRIFDDGAEVGTVTVAADGLTVVAASPSPAAFDILEESELASAGGRILEREHEPIPIPPLVRP